MLHINQTIDGFLSPDQLFIGEPVGMRALAFDCLAREFHKLFDAKFDDVINNIMKVQKTNRIDATIKAQYYIEQVRNLYADEAENLAKPIREIMYRAIEEEKVGNVNQAVQLFEQVAEHAFPPSTPYERLRIIYTKQGFYQDAIRICKRYIEVLNMVKAFWVDYPNIRSIPKYQGYIDRLTIKLNNQ